MTDLRNPCDLPTSTIRIIREDWSEFAEESPTQAHVLQFVDAYRDAPSPVTMQSLLAFPGPDRNDLLGAVLTLRFFDVVKLEPPWTSEEWVSLRDHVADRRPPGPGWPSTQHLRLHWLAGRQGGWTCRDCQVGLVDVCSDDDMAYDQHGRRFVRPGSGKELPTVDHEVPQSLGGSNLPVNLALVCRPCNSRKGAA